VIGFSQAKNTMFQKLQIPQLNNFKELGKGKQIDQTPCLEMETISVLEPNEVDRKAEMPA